MSSHKWYLWIGLQALHEYLSNLFDEKYTTCTSCTFRPWYFEICCWKFGVNWIMLLVKPASSVSLKYMWIYASPASFLHWLELTLNIAKKKCCYLLCTFVVVESIHISTLFYVHSWFSVHWYAFCRNDTQIGRWHCIPPLKTSSDNLHLVFQLLEHLLTKVWVEKMMIWKSKVLSQI